MAVPRRRARRFRHRSRFSSLRTTSPFQARCVRTARPTPEPSSVSSSELVLRKQLSIRLVVERRITSRIQVTHHIRDSIGYPV